MFVKTYTIESELPATQTFLSCEWMLNYGAADHERGQSSRWQVTLLIWRIQAIPNILLCFYPHDVKPYDNGVKFQWLHFRLEESAARPNQILPIYCQLLFTVIKPPILPCLLKCVLCLSARYFVELMRAEMQNPSVCRHFPCPQDKWQNNMPKKMKQLMDLERRLWSPGFKTTCCVLACACHWKAS